MALADADRRSASGAIESAAHEPRSLDAGARLEAALAPFAGRLEHDPQARMEAEAAIAATGVFREGRMFVSHVPERDVLYVYERGLRRRRARTGAQARALRARLADAELDGKECVGFIFGGLSEFDFEASENAAVWTGPRFDVPAFGIERGTIGLIAATARMVLGSFAPRTGCCSMPPYRPRTLRSALPLWEACLAEGNELARYALGYTLLALDRPREAHEQLKRYSALVRRNAWAWCYLGQACERLEDWEGAEYAYRQALEATASGSFDTDAAELLADAARAPRLASGLAAGR